MNWAKSIAREVLGLFVDDGSFAIAILVWVALAVGLARAVHSALFTGPVLFAGLALILIGGALRFARRPPKRP